VSKKLFSGKKSCYIAIDTLYTIFPIPGQSGIPVNVQTYFPDFVVFKNTHRENTMIKQELLDIIACPKCKGPLQLNEEKDGLICQSCNLIYEIRDDIPIMLIDEARPLNEQQSGAS
jgi:uncharacterized protein YbaR (Trm112 family)